MSSVFIETERLILRRLEPSDLADLVAYRNDPEVARYQGWESLSQEEAETLIAEKSTLELGTPGEVFLFGAGLKPDGKLIGDLGLVVKKWDSSQAMTGYTFSRAYQGQGYATEAFIGMLDFVFDPANLNLRRVMALVEPDNTPSWKLLERAGFRREGLFLQSRWFKGRWADDYQYAILQREWHEKRPPKI